MQDFVSRNGLATCWCIALETYMGWLTRALPGIEGFLIRRWLFRNLLHKCGDELYIYPDVRLSFTRRIKVGCRVAINSGSYLDGRGGLEIGDYVMIGPNCVISSCEHGFASRDTPMYLQPITYSKIVIENNVWIGGNVCVKSGVTIGEGSIIGGGSVVTKDIQSFSVVGGAPAKIIRKR